MRTFPKAVLTAIALFSMLATGAYASNKPATGTKASAQIECIALVMANEAKRTLQGYVQVGHSLLVRGASGDYGKVGDFCAAMRAPGQYVDYWNKKWKQPNAEMRKVATTMYNDWVKGRPTIEVGLQKRISGCAFFHNPTISKPESWSHLRKCDFVAGHYVYRSPRDRSPYRLASN